MVMNWRRTFDHLMIAKLIMEIRDIPKASSMDSTKFDIKIQRKSAVLYDKRWFIIMRDIHQVKQKYGGMYRYL